MNSLLKAATALLVAACNLSSHQVHGWDISEQICTVGYVMDQYCIGLGHFLDNPDGVTLAEPENHSFHCLLDVGLCYESGYVILTDYKDANGMHCIGARLDDTETEKVRTEGFETGSSDSSCTGCLNLSSDAPTKGLRVTIVGEVKANGDGSDSISGAPLLENIQVFDESVGCGGYGGQADLTPVCLPTPTEAPTEPPVASGADQVPSGGELSCPDTLDQSTVIDSGSGSTLFYAVVPDSPSGSGNGILCGRLEVENDGWIGLAFSPTGLMEGSTAIIGVPGGDVEKYDLKGYNAVPMPSDKQTLRDTSCSQDGGKTVMTFTKLLVEDGEVPILAEGENDVLSAWGGSAVGYHTGRVSTKIDFGTPAAPAAEIKVGDEICISNFVMDQFCINRGTFLDNPDIVTLAEPEKHSYHCLLDVERCWTSGYTVLTDKDPVTGMHCLGYRLDEADTEKVRTAGFVTGSSVADDGYCTGCLNESSDAPTAGFRATIKGTVKALGDGSKDSLSGVPVLENIQVLDESVGCETTIVNPVCLPPKGEEKEEEAVSVPPAANQDCTQDFCEQPLDTNYLLRYRINVPSDTTEDVCDGCTISMECIYSGGAWISIGWSLNGLMVGSEAVIGLSPGEEPLKYNLAGQSNAGVQPMPDNQQTLTDASVTFEDGKTIMKFTKIMNEPGEIEIAPGDNTFIQAYGTSPTLGYHGPNRGSIDINLSTGSSEAAAPPNKSAWLAHGVMAFLAWGVLVPFAVQSSLLRSLLPDGPIWFNLHRAFNTSAYALFIAAFAVAVATINKEGGTHFDNDHEKMGLAMFILAFFQVAGGAFRPHLPAPDTDDDKTQVRKGWEIGHRVVGVALLACGFWQMSEGITLYHNKGFISSVSGLNIAYWVWIGIMSAIIVFRGGYFKLKNNNASDTPASASGDAEAPVEDTSEPQEEK